MGISLDATSGWSWGTEVGARSSRHQAFGSRKQSIQSDFSAAPLVSNFIETTRKRGSSASSEALSSLQLAELHSFAREPDPEMFWVAWFAFGKRLETAGKIGLASEVYAAAIASHSNGVPLDLQKRIRDRLDHLQGKGPVAHRLEFFGSQFIRQATSMQVILPMIGGTLAGEIVGAAGLSRLAGSTARNGFSARLTAKAGGYLAEVSTFAVASRALSPASDGSFSHDFARAALTLGAFRLFARTGRTVEQALANHGVSLPLRGVLPATGAFLGLAASHKIETRLGLRPENPEESFFFETLSSLLTLSVGAYLGHRLMGGSLSRFRNELGFRSQAAGTYKKFELFAEPLPAASGYGNYGREVPTPLSQGIMMMSGPKKGFGNKLKSLAGEISAPGRATQMGDTGADIAPQGPPKIEVVEEIIEGRYQLEEQIGIGGMGAVYKAKQVLIGKKVALKILLANLSENQEAIERFFDEMRIVASIENDHVVDIKDTGRLSDGRAYFAMEYLEGKTLFRLLDEQKTLPPQRVIHLARQMAEGLSAAHGKGIVHRDLKPENIFITRRGEETDYVKVLDFGIAKIMGNGNKRLTQTGQTVGTALYMSPEQASTGGVVDQRADIYALGVLMYEMATGNVPFYEGTIQDVLIAHIAHDPKPFLELESPPQGFPAELEAIIMRCLAKKSEDRYQSMEELIVDLDKLKASSNQMVSPRKFNRTQIQYAPPPSRPFQFEPEAPQVEVLPKRSRRPLFGGLAAAGLIAAIAAFFATRESENVIALPDASPGDPPPPDASPKPTITPITPDAPEPLPKKKVELTVIPRDARVFLGDRDLGAKKVTIEIEEGSAVEVEVRREGFHSKKVRLDASRKQWPVRLERKRPIRQNPKDKPPDQIPPKDKPKDPGGSYNLGDPPK